MLKLVVNKVLAEPLVHFLLIAVSLFVIFDWLNPEEPGAEVIVISEGRLAQLNERFEKTWQRPPTSEESDNLLRNYALDEIYNREARLLGLDQNDSVVKKRMRQKMEFMLQDTLPQLPEASELEAFFQDNLARYRKEARLSFEHVYLSTDRPPEELEARAAHIRDQLAQGTIPEGDQSMLPSEVRGAWEREIARVFGRVFVPPLLALEQGEWQGPIKSGLGWHFVRLNALEPGYVPDLDAVYGEVLADWQYENAQLAQQRFEDELLSRYELRVGDGEPL